MKLRKRKGDHQFTDATGMDILVLDEALSSLLSDVTKRLDHEKNPALRAHYEDKQLAVWSLLGLVLHVRRGDCNESKCSHSTS